MDKNPKIPVRGKVKRSTRGGVVDAGGDMCAPKGQPKAKRRSKDGCHNYGYEEGGKGDASVAGLGDTKDTSVTAGERPPGGGVVLDGGDVSGALGVVGGGDVAGVAGTIIESVRDLYAEGQDVRSRAKIMLAGGLAARFERIAELGERRYVEGLPVIVKFKDTVQSFDKVRDYDPDNARVAISASQAAATLLGLNAATKSEIDFKGDASVIVNKIMDDMEASGELPVVALLPPIVK